MRSISTIELKEVISVTFERDFKEIITRKFAENNFAKYLFIKYCRAKGMSYSVIAKHLAISDVAAGRYMREYTPDVYVQELFECRFYVEIEKRLKTKK